MTDHDPHSHETQEGHAAHGTGHEVDAMPNRRLFNLLFGLSVITLLCCIALIQVFNRQAETISMTRAKDGSFLLSDYQAEMKAKSTGYGPTDEADKFRVPHAKAKDLVLAQPDTWFQAAAPPAGWIHPDDIAAGAQGGTASPPPAVPGEPGMGATIPTEGATGDVPTEGEAPAEAVPAEGGEPPSDTPPPDPTRPAGETPSDPGN